MKTIQPKIVYSPHYDFHFYGIEKFHPFDGRKFSRAWKEIIQGFDSERSWWLCPSALVNGDDLRRVHTEDYLELLKSPTYVAQALELPVLASLASVYPQFFEKHVLQPMRLATQGTILATEAALQGQIAINLGGGYHHARRNNGEGFCIYSDVAIAIAKLRNDGILEKDDRVLIVDLDVHQSNGLERIFYNDKTVYILDMYNQEIYPQDRWAQNRINCDIRLSTGTKDQEYLTYLTRYLPHALEELKKQGKIRLAFYIAGTDIYRGDQIGHLNISSEGVFKRDAYVFDILTSESVPWVMVLGGGYSKESYHLVAESVRYILTTYCGSPPTIRSST